MAEVATEPTRAPPHFGVVVVAASFGGLDVLSDLFARLPAYLPVPFLVVQHRRYGQPGLLTRLLGRYSTLPVQSVVDGMPVGEQGTVLLAPAGERLRMTSSGYLRLDPRPDSALNDDADTLFSTAAGCFGSRTLAVVLSGRLSDGAAGVRAVKRAGGRVLVQDPATAAAQGMPTAAIATGCADFVLPVDAMAPTLVALAMAPGAPELLKVPLPPWAPLGR